MSPSLYSQNWYRVDTLHPRLRTHVSVQRRVYRGSVWYLLRDTSSGRHHRVSETAYHIVGRLTGSLSVQQVWDATVEQLGERAPTQDEVIHLLSVLHDSHLIQSEMTPDVDELFQRRDSGAKKKRIATANPLYFRVPLLDPTAFLDRWVNWARPFYTSIGLMVWVLIIALAAIMLIPHWRDLALYSARLLEMRYLVLMALCYPIIKALHELGHAFAVRVWGGEVREMGVALMMLIPVPYVDASAASAFKERHRRVIVGAAGIMVELLLAALAGMLWLNTEQGIVRDIAFAVMAIGGISTALFNGNPLMRLDGYYVLSDALEIPNLGARANASVVAVIQRYLLGIRHARVVVTDGFERVFLPAYCLASNAYRLYISSVIVLWLASKSLGLAMILGGWMLFTQVGVPVYRAAEFVLRSSAFARNRMRAVVVSAGAVGGVVLLLYVVPVPVSSHALGVIWYPEQAQIRASTSGFVKSVHVVESEPVSAGDTVIELASPEAEAKHAVSVARVQVLQVRVRHALRDKPTDVQSATQELATMKAELADARRKTENLTIQAGATGRLILPHADDLLGTYVKQGTTLGHIVNHDDLVIRVAVTQEQAGRIRDGVAGVEIRLTERLDTTSVARVLHEVPAADHRLHSAALGDRAGGAIRTDPSDPDGLKTLEPVFLFDIGVPGVKPERVGGRVHVRFDHGLEPIGLQWTRSLRLVFLRHVNT